MMPQVCAAMIGTVAFFPAIRGAPEILSMVRCDRGRGMGRICAGFRPVGDCMLFLCGHGSGHFPVPGVSCHKPVPGYDFPYIRHIPAGAWRRDLLDRILSCHGPAGTGRAYRVCGG